MVLTLTDIVTKYNTILNSADPRGEANEFRRNYCYAIPTPEIIASIAKFIDAKSKTGVLSIYSGAGLWERYIGERITRTDIGIICTDIKPPGSGTKCYYPVIKLSANAALKKYKHDILFICMPPDNHIEHLKLTSTYVIYVAPRGSPMPSGYSDLAIIELNGFPGESITMHILKN